MKKIIYTLAIVMFSSLAFTACTEEEVAPAKESSVGGGQVSGDQLK